MERFSEKGTTPRERTFWLLAVGGGGKDFLKGTLQQLEGCRLSQEGKGREIWDRSRLITQQSSVARRIHDVVEKGE